uniref:PqqD family protein n=1 Tax=Streptomyces sp. NBC_00003 TaxID=2903608 RepID=A0AAU2VE52_9ACTN
MSALVPGGGPTVRLHTLTMVAEDDGVMVGRPDIGSYAVFPEEGAQVLRLLGAGAAVSDAAAWYERTCGERLDMDDFLGALEDLRFLRGETEPPPAQGPIRWQRLGAAAFSRPAWLLYVTLIAAAVAAMVRAPGLRPSYRNLFFTGHISLIPIVLFVTVIPCILVHEGFHTLAGRRLGLPSTLGIGRRLYYLVAETRLDSLLSVERRRRYLPFLAGMLADTVLFSVLTLLSVELNGHGMPAWTHKFCLALAFTCVVRLIWQFMFYLETDLYYVLNNALRCTDVQGAARFRLRSGLRRLLRREPPLPDTQWSDRDRAMARWYAPVLVSGYGFSLGSLAWAAIPTAWHFWSTAVDRFTDPLTPASDVVDAAGFVAITSFEIGLLIFVTLRDRRARTRKNSRQGVPT